MNLNFTKTLTIIILLSLFSIQNFAQTTAVQKTTVSIDSGKNLIKLNFASLVLKTINVQYERAIGKKTSVGLGIRFMPEGKLPFSSELESVDENIAKLTTNNFAITPEIKFYFGDGVFKGFYVAPFLRYAKYNGTVDYDFTVNSQTETMPFVGDLSTYTAGVLLGAQWRIAEKVYFDWSIFGPQYGFSDGLLVGTKSLNAQEQQALREELDGIDLPVGRVTTNVNANGATIKFDGPWAGIRANLGIGYRF